jgi:hypothetical protein
MKSFAAPSSSRGVRKKATPAPASDAPVTSRAAQLEQYRLKKQQQDQKGETVTANESLKRGVSSTQLKNEPPSKKHQSSVGQGRTAVIQSTTRKGSADRNVSSKVSAASTSSKRQTKQDRSNTDKENSDMLDMLKEHNKKFRPVALYEPSRHSVRDVRRWERSTGLSWASLAPDQRESANSDILKLKQQSSVLRE